MKRLYTVQQFLLPAGLPSIVLLMVPLLSGCAHPAAKSMGVKTGGVTSSVPQPGNSPAFVPAAPIPNTSPVTSPAPIVMTSYPLYRPLSPGQQTKASPLSSLSPGDNNVFVPSSGQGQADQGQANASETADQIAQGQVSLDNYQFQIKPDGVGGSVLDGSVSVHNHGPYDITDFQISLRESGRLYILIPASSNHQIPPAQGTVYMIHAAVPLTLDQLKTGKSFLLEAQLDGPPGLAMDEESGTTTLSTVPGH